MGVNRISSLANSKTIAPYSHRISSYIDRKRISRRGSLNAYTQRPLRGAASVDRRLGLASVHIFKTYNVIFA